MAHGPEMIGRAEMTSNERELVEEFEVTIDHMIETRDPKSGAGITWTSPIALTLPMQRAIILLYEDAGWAKVEWVCDQRDRGFFKFTQESSFRPSWKNPD